MLVFVFFCFGEIGFSRGRVSSYSKSSHQDRDCVLVWSSCAAHDCGSCCVVANALLFGVLGFVMEIRRPLTMDMEDVEMVIYKYGPEVVDRETDRTHSSSRVVVEEEDCVIGEAFRFG